MLIVVPEIGLSCVCVGSIAGNDLGVEGAKAFAEMLTVNKTLQSVKYVSPTLKLPFIVSWPLT